MIKRNIWLDGIMGVVVGDALGVPVEFYSQEELTEAPVMGMEGYGTYNMPAGTWSDDSSMALATLDSLRNGYDLKDIMDKFVDWYEKGKYTPHGKVFDVGLTCESAISAYMNGTDLNSCGKCEAYDNGNGSLMRIMPICLYMYEKQKEEGISDDEVIKVVHEVSALTHGHLRSKIACGIYFYIIRNILDGKGSLSERVQAGVSEAWAYYEREPEGAIEVEYYGRIKDIETLKSLPREEIHGYGYVVPTIEAALWSLVKSESYAEAALTAVNIGNDTDTVAAIAGGLAGLYYGYEGIPGEWLAEIACREWIEGVCAEFCNEAYRPIADEGDTHNAGNEEMDALEKSFCRRMGVKNIEEYLPILVKSIEEGNTPRNFGRKTLEMLMKHLKIHGYLPEPESQPSDKDGE